jgi:hypothetical protein
MHRPRGIKGRIEQELAKMHVLPAADRAMGGFTQTDFAAVCKTALRIDDSDADLKDLFRAAGLDYANPLHWRRLVTVLALLRSGRPGAPLQWGPEELCELLSDLDRLHSEAAAISRRKISVNELCRRLARSDRWTAPRFDRTGSVAR